MIGKDTVRLTPLPSKRGINMALSKPEIKSDLYAYLDTEQQAALYAALRHIQTDAQRAFFFEVLGSKFFLKGRGFSDALHSAKSAFVDKFVYRK